MSMGRLRLRVGNNSWNCIDLNKKRLQTDYNRNSFNRAVENEFLSMQLLSDMLAFESHQRFISICRLLMNQKNIVHGLESHWKVVFTYKVRTFAAVGAHLPMAKIFSFCHFVGMLV